MPQQVDNDFKGQLEVLRMAKQLGYEQATRALRKREGENEAEKQKPILYDLVLALDSIQSLLPDGVEGEGCKVEVSTKLGEKIFNGEVKNRRVAVVGQFNAGKTWVLENLFKYKFPQGSMLRTRGLSMKMDRAQSLLIIDSAGNLEPVSSELDVSQAVNDKKSVEILNKEFLVEIADVVILVVNQLTWPEQENAQALANRCNRLRDDNEDGKLFLIVHNMPGVQDPEEARKMFNDHVNLVYKGTKIQKMTRKSEFLEFVDDGASTQTRHFGVANQYSEAGRMYNQPVWDEILKMIDQRCPVAKNNNLREILERSGTNSLPQFFFTEPKTTKDNAEAEGDKEAEEKQRLAGAMRMEFEGEEGSKFIKEGTEQVLGRFKIKVDEDHVIHARHRGVSTALGDMDSEDLVWEPPVTIVLEKGEPIQGKEGQTHELKRITIEAAGVKMEHVAVESLDKGVLVTVYKVVEGSGGGRSLEDNRRYGTWKRLFEYVDRISGAQYDWSEQDFKVQDGIIYITLVKRELNTTLRKATKRADGGVSLGAGRK